MALHSQCDSASTALPRLDATSTGVSVNVESKAVFCKPKLVASASATGRTRAAMRARRASGATGPSFVRSWSRPGRVVGRGLAKDTPMARRPSTFLVKLRARR